MQSFERTDRAATEALAARAMAEEQPAPAPKSPNQQQPPPSRRTESPLRTPLTPRRRGNSPSSVSPRRRAAIADAFEAVKLDDDSALYTCLTTESNHVVDPNAAEPRNPKRTTLLHWAAYLGSDLCFELLLQCPTINVDAKESDGKTPLHYAAFQGNSDMIAALIDYGADECAADTLGQTPCHLARIAGREDIARMFSNYDEVLEQSTSHAVQSDTSFVPGGVGGDPSLVGEGDGGGGGDTLDAIASPWSTGGASPRLMPRQYQHQQQSTSMPGRQGNRSVSVEAHLGQAFLHRPAVANASSSMATSPVKAEQEQQNDNTNLPSPNISAVVHRQILGPLNEDGGTDNSPSPSPVKSPSARPVQQHQQQHNNQKWSRGEQKSVSAQQPQQQKSDATQSSDDSDAPDPRPVPAMMVDPALRHDEQHDAELQQMAQDEAELAELERELEQEEAAQRVAQAQLSWLDRIKDVAKQQNSLDNAQLSEQLWAVVESVESMLLIPMSELGSNGEEEGEQHGMGAAGFVRTEIEARAIEQMRSVTGNLERTLLQRRIEDEGVPLVVFRWKPQQQQKQDQRHVTGASISFADSHGNHHNNNSSNILSPLSPPTGARSSNNNNTAVASSSTGRRYVSPSASSSLTPGRAHAGRGRPPVPNPEIVAGFRSVPVLGRRSQTTSVASSSAAVAVATAPVPATRQTQQQHPQQEEEKQAAETSPSPEPEPVARDPNHDIPEEQLHFAQHYQSSRQDVPKFSSASIAAPVFNKSGMM